MPSIDQTFLTLHPRTALWWEQRETCYRCRHVRIRQTSDKHAKGSAVLQCLVVPRANGSPGQSCIDTRDEGQACGPDAKLFAPV